MSVGNNAHVPIEFYSQCALNLSYMTATRDWTEELVIRLQCIKTPGFRLSGALCGFCLPNRSKKGLHFF